MPLANTFNPALVFQRKLATVVFVLHWAGVAVTMATIGLFLRWKSGLGLRSRTPAVKNGQGTTQLLMSSDDEL